MMEIEFEEVMEKFDPEVDDQHKILEQKRKARYSVYPVYMTQECFY